MSLRNSISRRHMLGQITAVGAAAAAGVSTITHPLAAAAQEVGVKPADLPDLTIKEVKAYVVNVEGVRRLNGGENGVIYSMVTNSGIEGNYTDANRGTLGATWLDYAKANLVGKSVIDLLPMIPAGGGAGGGGGRGGGRGRGGGLGVANDGRGAPTTGPLAGGGGGGRGGRGGGRGGGGFGGGRGGGFVGGFGFSRGRQISTATNVDLYAAYADVILWDILGKAVNRPIYRLLGGAKDRMLAYASGQHLGSIEDYVPDVLKAKEMGFKAYKIHPGQGQHQNGISRIPTYQGHIEEIKQVRKAVGDEFTLLFDPVQGYNVFEAIRVGRVLDEEGYVSFEDPIPSTDLDGLIELRDKLDVPIEVGEFLYSVHDFGEYIRRGAMDIVRVIADNCGGISGSFRIGQLADAFDMPFTPHNWGNVMDIALHLHLELASPNAYWCEVPMPPDATDRPYHKDKFRLDSEGYIHAPTGPGMGYPLDKDAMDKIMIRIDKPA